MFGRDLGKIALLSAVSSVVVLAQDHGEEAALEMGPVAFLWPSDREWGAAKDNHAPCGSSAMAGINRTQFPLINGQVSLVAQDESWLIEVGLSHSSDPTSNGDFETVIAATRIPELNSGHMCYPVPNPAVDVEAGSNATLQIRYTSDWENDRNETYYACADIIYVSTSQFTTQVPCFNATIEDFEVSDVDDDNEDDDSDNDNNSQSANSSDAEVSASASSSGLSGGAIAGIVVGVVAGVGVLLGALVVFWRRKQQKKRIREQEASVRNVKWEDPMESGSNASNGDVALSDLRK